MPSLADRQKRVLRAEIRARRRALTPAERKQSAAGLLQNLQSLVTRTGATSLSCYLATTTEPDTRAFIDWARGRGIRILYPISRDDGLLDWTAGERGTEATGRWGIPEAAGAALGTLAIADVDLVIVPACAVDTQGTRLGWGRGYFDKTLSVLETRPPVFALVFDNEVLPEVPTEAHDQPVDGVVTPCRILDFSSN